MHTYTYVNLSNTIVDIAETDLNFAGNWSSGSTYFFGDVTLFNTTRYIALAANQSKTPPITQVRDNNWSALVLSVTGSFAGTAADAAAALSLANTAYGLATYAVSIAGTAGGGSGDATYAYVVARAALETAWKGTTIGLQAQAVATTALSTSWTGTNLAETAYDLATYAISLAGTVSGSSGTGSQAQADAAYALARAALTTAWTGTGDGAQANAVATAALSTAWIGTSSGAAAMAVATDALTTAWAGTAAASAAMTVATDALTTSWTGTSNGAAAMAVATAALSTAWTGTGNGAQANAVATDALSTAWTGTAAAAAALALAQAAFNSAGSGTGSAAVAQASADAAMAVATAALSTSWVGTGDGAEARRFASGAYDLAIVGTNAAAAALAVAVQGTTAGAAFVQANVATSIATSAYTLASTGTLLFGGLGPDWVIEDFESYATGSIDKFTGGFGWSNDGTLAGGGGTIVAYNMPDGSIDRRLLMAAGSNCEYLRQMPWGSKWHKLRFGVLARLNSHVTFPGGNQTWFAFGVSGTNGFRGTPKNNWFGLGDHPAVQLQTLTYNQGREAGYFSIAGVPYELALQVGGVVSSSLSTAGAYFPAEGTNRLMILGDIKRDHISTANNTAEYQGAMGLTTNTADAEADDNLTYLLTHLNTPNNVATAPGFLTSDGRVSSNPSAKVVMNETAGTLSHFSFVGGNMPPLEISAIVVHRVRA